MEDKPIECCDCGETFVWTMKDQEFYKKNDFQPPKRCKPCRERKKAERAKHKPQKTGRR